MSPTKNQLMWIYKQLHSAYGPRNWWPADTDFEVVVGAILTQQAPWTNVEKAIDNLKSHGLLKPERLGGASITVVERLVRPAGFYKVKSRRIVQIAKDYEKVKATYSMPIDKAREELLSINGIGPETCDSILLYAGGMPTFVIDAYTKRLASRYGLVAEETVDYHELKDMFEKRLHRNERLYNEYHALIVELGKRHCKMKPECGSCPLSEKCKKNIKGRKAKTTAKTLKTVKSKMGGSAKRKRR